MPPVPEEGLDAWMAARKRPRMPVSSVKVSRESGDRVGGRARGFVEDIAAVGLVMEGGVVLKKLGLYGGGGSLELRPIGPMSKDVEQKW